MFTVHWLPPPQITGVLFIVIGTWARLQKVKIGSLDYLATDPAFFLLTLGSIMFVISMPGCLGSLRENVLLLKLVSVECMSMSGATMQVCGMTGHVLSKLNCTLFRG